jgi:ribonuclease Z
MESRLGGYSWNLLDGGSAAPELHATEITPDGSRTRVYSGRDGFTCRQEHSAAPHPSGCIHAEPEFTVSCTILDHGIPCLGFRLDETVRVRIDRRQLERLGMKPGPWLAQLKATLRRKPDAKGPPLTVPRAAPASGSCQRSLQWLAKNLCTLEPGYSIAYIADVAYNTDNAARIATLVHGADHLFIEAVFRDRLAELAAKTRHLTTGQAGELAGRAKVRRVTPFHFSSRHAKEVAALEAEIADARRKWL